MYARHFMLIAIAGGALLGAIGSRAVSPQVKDAPEQPWMELLRGSASSAGPASRGIEHFAPRVVHYSLPPFMREELARASAGSIEPEPPELADAPTADIAYSDSRWLPPLPLTDPAPPPRRPAVIPHYNGWEAPPAPPPPATLVLAEAPPAAAAVQVDLSGTTENSVEHPSTPEGLPAIW